jgi:hypothetical protein
LAGILRLRKRAGFAVRRDVLLSEAGSGGSTAGQIRRRAVVSGRFPRAGSALALRTGSVLQACREFCPANRLYMPSHEKSLE